jgi:serine/threonine-protein kinase
VSADELVRRLRDLAELHAAGAVTAEEFTLAKVRLLESEPAAPARTEPSTDATDAVVKGTPPDPETVATPDAAVAAAPAAAAPAAAIPTAMAEPTHAGQPPTARRPLVGLPAVLGGGLALFAFLFLPLAELPMLGPATAAELAGHAADEGGLGGLWIALLAALVVVAAGVWALASPAPDGTAGRRAWIYVLVGAAVGAVTYAVLFGVVEARLHTSGADRFGISAADLAGPGFWLGLLGLVAAGIGAAADRAGSSRPRPGSDHPPTSDRPPGPSGSAGSAPDRDPAAGAAMAIALLVGAAIVALVVLRPGADTSAAGSTRTAAESPTSPVTTVTTTTRPVRVESAAEWLDGELTRDRATAEGLVDSWVPQLAAMRIGSVVDGTWIDHDAVRARLDEIRRRFPDALLVWSSDYSSFTLADHYVVVASRWFGNGSDAIGWCVQQSLPAEDCFAKRLSHSEGPDETTVYQSE